MIRPSLLLPLLLLVPACDAATSSQAVVPNLTDGKADVADRVVAAAPLQFEAAVTGAFDEDLQFFGHALEVRAGAEVRLDVTHAGTASKLDTTMFVYGPRTAAGGYGTEAIAFDDDAGWGRHSRLDMVFDQAGEYLVVLGTHDGRGRGRYRLLATCDDDACGP